MPPETIADTIIAVLNAVRPRAAAHHPGDEEAAPCQRPRPPQASLVVTT